MIAALWLLPLLSLATPAEAGRRKAAPAGPAVIPAADISTGTLRVETTSGTAADLTTTLAQQTTLHAAAAGVASFVKDHAWCVQAIGTPAGYRYLAKVLAFLPNTSSTPAAEAAIHAAP